MRQKELIDYRIIHAGDPQEESRAYPEDEFETKFAPLGVELRGVDLLALSKLFLFWREKTGEIVYRQHPKGRALVIFSRLDPDRYFRSEDILPPAWWPESELIRLEGLRADDHAAELVWELGTITKSLKDAEMPVSDFLSRLYSVNPRKERIVLEGQISPYLLLMALDWFAGEAKSVTYNTEKQV